MTGIKVKSVSDLAFKALDELTDVEDELWVAHIVFDGQASKTGDIQKLMKDDCGTPYYFVQSVLKTLVAKGLIIREYQGQYTPNLRMILDKMVEVLEGDK